MYSESIVRQPESQIGAHRGRPWPSFASRDMKEPDDFSFEEFWRVLVKRKKVVIGCVAFCILSALVLSLIMKTRYEAIATIEINKEQSDMLSGLEDMGGMMSGSTDGLDANITMQTQANIVESDTLALQVIKELGLEQQPDYEIKYGSLTSSELKAERNLPLEQARFRREKVLKRYHKNVSVKTVSGTREIEVHVLDRNPEMAAQIANTLVNDYFEHYYRTRFSATMQASDWLSKQLDDLKKQVEDSEQRLVDYQKQNGIIGGDEANNVILAKLEELNTQLTAAEANRITKEAVYRLAKTGDPELISGMAGSGMIAMSAGGASAPSSNPLTLVQSMRAQEADLKTQYAQATTKFGAAYPRVIQIKNQIIDLQNSIHEETGKVAERAKNDYIAAKSSEDMLRASFDRQKEETNKLNDAAIQYTILKQEAESGRDLYEDLLGKLKEAGVLAGLRSTNIDVVDPARPAAKAARPNYPLNLGLGTLAGLIFGVAFAFVIDNRDSTLSTPEDVENAVAMPALGFVPYALLTNNGHGKARWALRARDRVAEKALIATIASPHSHVAEAYRALRTSLLLSSAEAPPKIVVITSALPGEGKSTTCINAAVVLAKQSAKVLLVDADMRRPSVAEALGVVCTKGLSSILTGNATSEEVTFPVPHVENLYMIPAGIRPPNPAEILGSKCMSDLLDKWRKEFDHVVIDSPPVLSVTDPVVLASKADAVVLVVRSGQTSRQSLIRTRELLHRVGSNVAGVLVNAVDVSSPDYRYSYGYSYGPEYAAGYHEELRAES